MVMGRVEARPGPLLAVLLLIIVYILVSIASTTINVVGSFIENISIFINKGRHGTDPWPTES